MLSYSEPSLFQKTRALYWSIAVLQRLLWAIGHDVGPVATKWIEAWHTTMGLLFLGEQDEGTTGTVKNMGKHKASEKNWVAKWILTGKPCGFPQQFVPQEKREVWEGQKGRRLSSSVATDKQAVAAYSFPGSSGGQGQGTAME
eukprot:Skav212889  [mRNA]  locus=scaffold4893:12250:13624:- [translate_table: standard]